MNIHGLALEYNAKVEHASSDGRIVVWHYVVMPKAIKLDESGRGRL